MKIFKKVFKKIYNEKNLKFILLEKKNYTRYVYGVALTFITNYRGSNYSQ